MLIRVLTGFNAPQKNGDVTPANPGDIIDVPQRFALQQIAIGRAEDGASAPSALSNPEADLKTKIVKG